MVKKINKFGVTVKTLLDAGYPQTWIARQLKYLGKGSIIEKFILLKALKQKKENLLKNIFSF